MRRAVAVLLLLALVARTAMLVATPDYRPVHDDRDYDRLACWVAEHGLPPDRVPAFPGPASCAETGRPSVLTAYRPPLWPELLGGAYAVAGATGIPRWTAGRALQVLIGVVVVALTGAVAGRLWGRRTGLVALGLGAVFLPLVLDGATLISEPLFVALALGALLAVLRHRRSGGVWWALAAGGLIGLAALTRSSGVLLALAGLTAIAWPPRRWAAVAAYVLAAVLVVAPWTIRNASVLHAFVPVSTEVGPTLLGTYNPAAAHPPDGCVGCWVLLHQTPGEIGLARRLAALSEVARDHESRALALDYARAHPGYVLRVAWENSVRLLELGGAGRTRFTAGTIDVPPGVAVAGAWELWALLAVIVAGLAAGAWRAVPAGLAALLAFLWVTTVLVQSETPRFRAAIDPFLIGLAALGLVTAARRLRR